MSTPDLTALLEAKEGENTEFKEAKNNYSFDNLAKYCCAMSNEGGGRVVLGVTDKRPRRVVGTAAFPQPEETRRSLVEKLHLRIDFTVFNDSSGRVLVFEVPPRPVGMPIRCDNVYWSREADSVVPMANDKLRAIFAEGGHDFSADVCRGAKWTDLDAGAIDDFKRRWIEKSKNATLANLGPEQLLHDAEAVTDDGITYAGLALFGTHQALGKHLGQAEIVFEYRSSDVSGPAQQRMDFRQGFFSIYDEIWKLINLRNDTQHYQDGLFMLDIPTFAERSVREALLNAISHRDYQLGGSVFVRQYSRRLVVESPGGFPVGINLDNMLDRQSPRNRRIADIFARCGLVERSGQGMNLMFEQSIQQGKLLPDFAGTDSYHVVVTLYGEMRDPLFVRFLERIGRETTQSFDTHDFLVLDMVHKDQPIPSFVQPRVPRLLDLGVIERAGRGRIVLCRQFYASTGRRGVYTRKKGLDRGTKKSLLFQHIEENAKEGSRMNELQQILPEQPRSQIQVYLRELRDEGKIHVHGHTKAARWYPGQADENCNHPPVKGQ